MSNRSPIDEDELSSLRRSFGFAGLYDEIQTPGGEEKVEVEDVSQEEMDFRYNDEDDDTPEDYRDDHRTPDNSGHSRDETPVARIRTSVPYTTLHRFARNPRRESVIMENARRQSGEFPGVRSRAPPPTQE